MTEVVDRKRYVGAFERLILVNAAPQQRWKCEWCSAEAERSDVTFPHFEDCPTLLLRHLEDQNAARRRTWRELVKVADAAYHALESYAHSNATPDLAREIAAALNEALQNTRDAY